MARKQSKPLRDAAVRAERLGFRLDRETKHLIERAAHLERRKLTDFCVEASPAQRAGPSPTMRHSRSPSGTDRPSSMR